MTTLVGRVSDTERRTGGRERQLPALVLEQLAGGGFQSGADLARRLGVSRNAIWKAVGTLRSLGLEIHAVHNRGYRVPVPCEPLDADAIREALGPEARRRVRNVEVAWSIDSTNAALLARADPPRGLADILIAEYQTAGRGRRGRAWMAPPGGAICLSIGWSFPQLPPDLAALSLAVGVCALRAVRGHTSASSGAPALKWPNDLTLADRKLGGILIEMRAESAGPTYVVVGIGVNVALGTHLLQQVAATGTRAADLASAGADPRKRNAIAAELAEAVIAGLARFQHDGFRPFLEEWQAADALRGRPVTVYTAETRLRGVARGIDASGALLVQTPQGLERIISGDVSVRAEETEPST